MFNWIKKSKWQTVFFTCDLEEFSKMKGKLIYANIETKTKIINNRIRHTRETILMSTHRTKNYYELMVKKEDADKAHLVMKSKN